MSSTEKNTFCQTSRKLLTEEDDNKKIIYLKPPKYISTKYFSIILALTSALFTFFTILALSKDINIVEGFNKYEILTYFIVSLSIPLISLFTIQLLREIKRKKNRKLSEIEKIKGFIGKEDYEEKKQDKSEIKDINLNK